MKLPILSVVLVAVVTSNKPCGAQDATLRLDPGLLYAAREAFVRPIYIAQAGTWYINDIRVPRELQFVQHLAVTSSEFAAYQKEELDRLSERFTKDAKLLTEDHDGKTESAEFRAQAAVLQDQLRKDIAELLLPHQRSTFQAMVVAHAGLPSALSGGGISDELKLTDEQRQKIMASAKKQATELEAELRKLKKKAITRLLSQLTEEQRARLSKIIKTDDLMAFYQEVPLETIISQLKQPEPKRDEGW